MLDSVRSALRRFDPMLNVWWSPNRGYQTGLPGRWRIVRFADGNAGWATEFYWEGRQGQYRPLAAEPILAEVRRQRWKKRRGIRRLAEMVSAQNERINDRRMRALDDLKSQRLAEVRPVMNGRITSAPGYIRKRDFALPTKRNWAKAMANPELYDKLDDYDKAIVDHMRRTGFEP